MRAQAPRPLAVLEAGTDTGTEAVTLSLISGKAAVTYRVVSGVMLASGDPLGDVEAWPGAIERFMHRPLGPPTGLARK